MAKYLIEGKYVGDGVQGLLKEGGSGRREAVTKLVESVGGSVDSIYYAFGGVDVYVIADFPDHPSAAAAALTAAASGAVSLKTTVLLTPEEIDQATKKSPAFRAPGA